MTKEELKHIIESSEVLNVCDEKIAVAEKIIVDAFGEKKTSVDGKIKMSCTINGQKYSIDMDIDYLIKYVEDAKSDLIETKVHAQNIIDHAKY